MSLLVRASSAWKNVEATYVRDGGTWKATTGLWVRQAGQWVPVYLATGGSTAPTAAPSNVARYTYGGSKLGVSWTNGDATSESRVYRQASAGGTWTLVTTVPAGVTTCDTGTTSAYLFGVSHIKNTVETAITEEAN